MPILTAVRGLPARLVRRARGILPVDGPLSFAAGEALLLVNPTAGRGASISIAADRPLNAYADGEPVGPLPVTIGIERGSLRVLLPPRRGP